MLPGFETATGTDDLLVEIQAGSGVLSNEYAGGQGSYESYGYYRYGFNGKENDNEVKGQGNQQDYGMRIYDPRLGRFLSVDPITSDYPELTPYQFASNTPIWAIDIDGLEAGLYQGMDLKTAEKVYEFISNKFNEWISSPADEGVVKAYEYKFGVTPGAFKNSTNGDVLFWSLASWGESKNKPGGLKIPNTRQPQTPKASVPSTTGKVKSIPSNSESIKTLTVETYANARKANTGSGNSADHIPSFASAKAMREQALGRQLTLQEAAALKNQTLTLTIQTNLHRSTSLTYGGRNSRARISEDSKDPLKAITENVNAYRPALRSEGYTDGEIDAAIKKLAAPYQSN